MIPVQDSKYAIGQVLNIRHGGELYIAVWRDLVGEGEFKRESLLHSSPWLGALTLDALIWHGRWPKIDNYTDNMGEIPRPYFKLNDSGVYNIVDIDLEPIREVKSGEMDQLINKTTVAPIVVQDAVQAWFGIGDWNRNDDKLLFEYVIKSSAIALGGAR
jgi:hypothetical protein